MPRCRVEDLIEYMIVTLKYTLEELGLPKYLYYIDSLDIRKSNPKYFVNLEEAINYFKEKSLDVIQLNSKINDYTLFIISLDPSEKPEEAEIHMVYDDYRGTVFYEKTGNVYNNISNEQKEDLVKYLKDITNKYAKNKKFELHEADWL